ncbi:MAG: membrane integrity-associated transporter subunit PqiC [Betaproteobacteria bacterium]|nr:membrane integrity-associated transporter subunit PqiC [Betaproteobacteria bacterium]
MSARRSSRPGQFPHGPRAAGTATLLAAMLLAGCGNLLPKPPAPPLTYTLEAGREVGTPPAAAAASAPTLTVSALQAAAGYDSARIVYLRRPQQLEAYAQSVWVDTPARMLAPLLVAALQRSGAYAAVVSAPSAAASTLRLDTEVLRLRQDFDGGTSVVTLSLRATLVDGASRRVLGSRDFSATVPAATADSAGGVQAAQAATRQVLATLADWCAAAASQTGSRTPR